jgi:hypothetical protein
MLPHAGAGAGVGVQPVGQRARCRLARGRNVEERRPGERGGEGREGCEGRPDGTGKRKNPQYVRSTPSMWLGWAGLVCGLGLIIWLMHLWGGDRQVTGR